jgi:sec-independent protein translocase protein TatA
MIGHWEILAIIAVILIIFGPSKLPALGRSIGEGVKNLKRGLKGGGDEEEDKEGEGKKEKKKIKGGKDEKEED